MTASPVLKYPITYLPATDRAENETMKANPRGNKNTISNDLSFCGALYEDNISRQVKI